MAMSIPINLANFTAQQNQPDSMANVIANAVKTTTVQPAGASADARGAATDGDGNKGQHPAERWPQALKPRTAAAAKPEGATPTSVVNAQTIGEKTAGVSPSKDGLYGVTLSPDETLADRPNKVDRYAPPDPLPTAPILKNKTDSA